ncbi:DNA-3-methyladenine glycosylase 2 family protein [Polynucleobacter sp. AP-Elch-400A-B2]|uniref:DNA-3-methyladenine glycosylase family protein n=1 Tax=Polynucleobacter sp. AP-Elch-400A-B2 TaxID=2576930 RepID=UPI0020413963|nr:DNA-3-methyladenine glycosylase [Polynucleobacter sp. AP-Elch-400A-B2]QWE25597.1 DNA-3-methyladenine glycosylase 2 family protein [Polynucleobacter sp. AP-Elch-400A-B2]
MSKVAQQVIIEEIAPDYWEQACAELMKHDRILKKLIPKYGSGFLRTRGDAFTTLARSIVGQQISVAAAQSVWTKVLLASKNKVNPKNILTLSVDDLRAAGLSGRKVEYIRDLAEHFDSGRLHANQWKGMEDEAIIKELCGIRGIGRWTAEMFLIFNMIRPNILPMDDAGLIKAISLNYFSGEPVSRHEAREVAANWAPWRTVATWYMWRSIDPKPVEY